MQLRLQRPSSDSAHESLKVYHCPQLQALCSVDGVFTKRSYKCCELCDVPLQQPQSCPRDCDSVARQECKSLFVNVLLPHGMTTPYMHNPERGLRVHVFSRDDHKLCWELMGAIGLRACLKRAWHGHPESETEDT